MTKITLLGLAKAGLNSGVVLFSSITEFYCTRMRMKSSSFWNIPLLLDEYVLICSEGSFSSGMAPLYLIVSETKVVRKL